MREYNIRLWEELETDTPIEWWNVNREKLNEAIRMVNNWQINNRQDKYEGYLVLAKIESIIVWSQEHGKDFSEWQTEMLEDIHSHVKEVLEETEQGD